MILNSVSPTFSGNSGSSQGANGSSNQSDPASEDTSASGSDQTDGAEASGSTGSSNASSGSSDSQTGSQTSGQSTASNASNQAATPSSGTSTQTVMLTDEAPKAATDVNALRTEALEVQKRFNTEMLIKSLGAAPETDLSLLGEAESETAVPLAVAAYAENFAPSAAETGRTAA